MRYNKYLKYLIFSKNGKTCKKNCLSVCLGFSSKKIIQQIQNSAEIMRKRLAFLRGKGRYIALPDSLFEVSVRYYVVQYRVTGALCKALAHADSAGYYSFENDGHECRYERSFLSDPHGIFPAGDEPKGRIS